MNKVYAILLAAGLFLPCAHVQAESGIEDYIQCGNALKSEGKYKEAVSEYSRAIKEFPDNPLVYEAYYRRGVVSTDYLSNHSAAISDCAKAINYKPDNPDYLYCRAVANFRRQNWNEAIKDYDKIISINPSYSNGEAYYAKGYSYFKLLDYGQAITNFTNACKISSTCAKYFIDRGAAYYDVKNYKAAKNDWLKAQKLKLDPQEEKILSDNLGLLAKVTGTKEKEETELPRRAKKIPWAQKQRSRTPADKALAELLEDEDIRLAYDKYKVLYDKANSAVSESADFSAAADYFDESVKAAEKLKAILEEKGMSGALGDFSEKMSEMMVQYCRSTALIMKVKDMFDNQEAGIAAFNKQLKLIDEAQALNSKAMGIFNELKSLCRHSSAIELEAIGCNGISSLEKPLSETEENISVIKNNLEESIEGLGGKIIKEKPVAGKSPEVKTDFEKPKSIWELMWGSGKDHSTQKEEAIPKEESRDKYFPDEDEVGDFE